MCFQDRQKIKNHRNPQSPFGRVCPDRSVLDTPEWSGARSCCCGDVNVFAIDTRKTKFSNSTVFKSFHSGERLCIDSFSLISIVFGFRRCSVDGV